MPDIINPGTAVIAGSVVGYLPRKYSPIYEKIKHGDVIILLGSSSVHSNGITLVRRLAAKEPNDGLQLCREALVPTRIYVSAMNALLVSGIVPHYAIHITGHGFRKIMRARPEFTYVIEDVPVPHRIFGTIQKLGNIKPREMWGNYNMGAGFALIVDPKQADATVLACSKAGYSTFVAGHVENGPKQVKILPAKITFEDDSMKLR